MCLLFHEWRVECGVGYYKYTTILGVMISVRVSFLMFESKECRVCYCQGGSDAEVELGIRGCNMCDEK